ncbi:putative wall-associated receptor kinase-like 16 [Pistacia vera]|uniref:putative wall-associated receptor kinase-like 16 n=1 Tax=Pistacia vera TaxID=55513 RepID=UPI001262BE1E|nr:putative wall-associated receptor kinase-like 16 [Pistacia vera]
MGFRGVAFQLMLAEMLLTATLVSSLSKPGCDALCGDLEIPYPFGTSLNCSLNKDFLIACNHSSTPPKALYRNESDIPVTKVNITTGQLHISSFISRRCHPSTKANSPWYNLPDFLTVSNTENKFTVIGCNSYAYIRGHIDDRNYKTGCISLCENISYVDEGSCTGTGCCQIDIPKGLKRINYTAYSFNNVSQTNIPDIRRCTYAFVAEQSKFKFKPSYIFDNLTENFPMVLDWAITGNAKCEECKENTECETTEDGSRYRCKCKTGYEGNPYLSNSCQDINECDYPDLHKCTESQSCINNDGSYTCSCREGYERDEINGWEGCNPIPPNEFPVVKVAMGVGIFFVVLLVSSTWLYLVLKKRKLIKLKEKFFQQNDGFLLQQQLSKRSGSSETAKIFTAEELKKATNNYDESRIIGRGGFGTVYKGFLTDNTPVAIKMSKTIDESQIEQFVNEVVVLSQINHRNVVRLLGCCLETEVPLLVYEFVSNGTLFEHIHDKDKAPTISWEIRLRIAAETAGVLSYLHSAAATPIIHRDVKSTNILLDHNFTAKVSDFGASKLVPIDETQLSTMVQGTLGYLDPEYLHTSQLTEKSDVYSFGVVLAELLTGKKALLFDRPEEQRSLVMYFLTSLQEGCLFEILENYIVNDGNEEQLKEVAELAKICLKVKGEERPTMREVAMELDGLRMMHKHSWVNTELNPEETEHLLRDTSDVYKCADGSSTSAGYDSIKDHVLVVFDDGR